MGQESSVSSEFFFHFTDKIEYIEDMMLNGFKPFYCPEMLEYLADNELKTIELAYPVICFCDLPLNLQEKHQERFGRYGIGLKKEWGLKNYLTPVIYSHNKAITSGIVKNFIDIYKKLDNGLNKSVLNQTDFFTLRNCFSLLIMSTKPYEGRQYIKVEKRFSNYLSRFYDEREWRFIPTNVDGLNLSLEMDDYNNPDKLKCENEKIQKNNILNFVLDDIEFIFLKHESEIEPFSNNLRTKYLESEIEVIINKIKLDK